MFFCNLVHDYTLWFISLPSYSVSYYNYISIWPYYSYSLELREAVLIYLYWHDYTEDIYLLDNNIWEVHKLNALCKLILTMYIVL